jgi:hypothetical protein
MSARALRSAVLAFAAGALPRNGTPSFAYARSFCSRRQKHTVGTSRTVKRMSRPASCVAKRM